MIAPCGMNCSLCLAYIREKNKCPGCHGRDTLKKKTRVSCIIKSCEKLRGAESRFCYSCEAFPCRRLKQLDARYRKKYGMSMISNLRTIETEGLDRFVEMETQRWACRKCGALLCVHRQACLNCGDNWNPEGTIRGN